MQVQDKMYKDYVWADKNLYLANGEFCTNGNYVPDQVTRTKTQETLAGAQETLTG